MMPQVPFYPPRPSVTHPIWTPAEAMEYEQTLLEGEAEKEWTAMGRVGQSLARSLRADFGEVGDWPGVFRMLLLVGKGHNGGDALLAAAALLESGYHLELQILSPVSDGHWKPLTRRALERLQKAARGAGCGLSLHVWPRLPVSQAYDGVLDGLLGMQCQPPLRKPLPDLLRWVNEHPAIRFRVAVDLPSGLAEKKGEAIFRADLTYLTALAKSPVFAGHAASWVGRIRYLDIGFCANLGEREEDPQRPVLLVEDCLHSLRQPRPATHFKNRAGHVWVMGGSLRYPGAVMMTVQAALKAGAGLVSALVPEALVPAFAARLPEAMWVGCPVQSDGMMDHRLRDVWERLAPQPDALIIGPGLGAVEETLTTVAAIAQTVSAPVLLDADALHPVVAKTVSEKASGHWVLTPHRREWERFFGIQTEAGLITDAQLRESADRYGVTLLLKGPPYSRITDGRRMRYNITGGPVLARGGSGDCLAGIAGALLAAEEEPNAKACWEALSQAVYWHGAAADQLAREQGARAVTSTEILTKLRLA